MTRIRESKDKTPPGGGATRSNPRIKYTAGNGRLENGVRSTSLGVRNTVFRTRSAFKRVRLHETRVLGERL